ncbi:MAG: DNA-processing protein DprA [Desulfobacterales bacterium]|nr:MAG: DNA-processing protein DprA [Desulfobacterales bacterium]
MENLQSWFSLKSVPGIGNHLFKRLLNAFASPQRVFEAAREQLLQVEGVTPRIVTALQNHKPSEDIRKELDRIHQKGFWIVTMLDSSYPRLLREIPDPPPYLYVYGKLDEGSINIAVVGSRHATTYGITTTRDLCNDLAALGITVVSGMARGIDTAAHEGALMGKGKTIAVLGCGLDRVYPAENQKLYHRISENGAVVSEFALTTEPEAHNFPIRNRIISGISHGTVVVEASKKSGSLITARLAAEQNREVFAVPGSVQSFKSIGTHTLIKQGAKLVEHAQDIIEELYPIIKPHIAASGNLRRQDATRNVIASLPPEEVRVYEMLGPYPEHIDDLARKISMETGKLSSILLKLELKGIVQQSPGKLFSVMKK